MATTDGREVAAVVTASVRSAIAAKAKEPRRLLLLGFVNVDPRGPARLAGLLRRERPRRIGIERSTDLETEAEIERISRQAVSVLMEKLTDAYSESTRKEARDLARKVTAAVGYDVREVEKYVADSQSDGAEGAAAGQPLEVIRIESTIERYNFALDLQRKARSIQGVREPHLKRPDYTLEAFQRQVDGMFYNERAVAMALSTEGLVGRRQEIMAQKLLDTKCDCAVVGFAHIVDYRGTLFNRLKHLKPRRIGLNAAE